MANDYFPKILCVGGVNAGCDSAHFNTRGVTFQHICGQTKSYQKGWPDAFTQASKGIDEIYVNGLSITLGHHGSTFGLMQVLQDTVYTTLVLRRLAGIHLLS